MLPLNESGFATGSAIGVPEAIPGLVRFPAPPAIEEIHVEPLRVCGEHGSKGTAPGSGIGRDIGKDRRGFATS